MDERDVARFWSKVERGGADECWEWTALRNRKGYGIFHYRPNRKWVAHRLSWVFHNGQISEDGIWLVCHRCDNPPCCNPAHLFLGTPLDNMQDMRRKGRHLYGETHQNSVLTEADVVQMRELWAAGATAGSLGLRFGVGDKTARDACVGNTWAHLPNPGQPKRNKRH